MRLLISLIIDGVKKNSWIRSFDLVYVLETASLRFLLKPIKRHAPKTEQDDRVSARKTNAAY